MPGGGAGGTAESGSGSRLGLYLGTALAIVTGGTSGSGPGSRLGLYPRLLGADWHELDPAVRRAHGDGPDAHAVGSLRVCHGPGRLARFLLRAARVPPPADAAEVRLVVSRCGPVERWHRTLGGRPLVTVQREAPGGLLAERLGSLEFRFRLAAAEGALTCRQVGFAFYLGPLRVPVPGWLSPRVAGRAGPAGGADRTSVAVEVAAPAGGLLFSYRGTVRWGGMSR